MKTLQYIDRNLGTLSSLLIAAASILSMIAGWVPDQYAAMLGSAAIGAGLVGRGIALHGQQVVQGAETVVRDAEGANPAAALGPVQQLVAEMRNGLAQLEHIRATANAPITTTVGNKVVTSTPAPTTPAPTVAPPAAPST